MLRETQTDRTANSIESISSSDQQEFHKLNDSTGEVLQWKRANLNNPIIRSLEDLTKMLGHAVLSYSKNAEKRLKHLRKF